MAEAELGDETNYPLSCGRRWFGDDEVPEQDGARLGLQRARVNGQEMIAEGAFLLVVDQVRLQNLLPALCARHDEGQGRRVAW